MALGRTWAYIIQNVHISVHNFNCKSSMKIMPVIRCSMCWKLCCHSVDFGLQALQSSTHVYCINIFKLIAQLYYIHHFDMTVAFGLVTAVAPLASRSLKSVSCHATETTKKVSVSKRSIIASQIGLRILTFRPQALLNRPSRPFVGCQSGPGTPRGHTK